jgi:catechol 2,3-dioxygenase-like lactoylglutathione lyase family enzyme
MEVLGLDHIYVSVSDFGRSEAFYDRVMQALGFRKGDKAIDGEPHAHYFNRVMQYTIRPAHTRVKHDPYAPGMHHVSFQVTDRAAVDEMHRTLGRLGIESTAPKEYPEYNSDYYATFFQDPDGIRLEVVARSKHREHVAAVWNELEAFLNPIADWQNRKTRSS